jgi:hypothetical protein
MNPALTPLFVSRPLLKIGVSCASAFLLFSAQVRAQTTTTITETLQNIPGGGASLVVPNFSAQGETLIDVTFTLMLGNDPVTIFDTQNSGKDLINIIFTTSNHASPINGDSFASWKLSPGTLKLTYSEDTRNAADYGAAPQFLFGTHGNQGAEFLQVNYVCTCTGTGGNGGTNGGGSPIGGGGTNPNSGGSPATPEPGVKYLSFVAAGAMALLLAGRNWRRRIFEKRG